MSYTNQYFRTIPASLVGYSTERGQMEAAAGYYEVEDTTSAQLTSLQSQVTELTKQVTDLIALQYSQTYTDTKNLLLNPACEYWSIGTGGLFYTTDTTFNGAFILNGRASPTMDKWFICAEMAGMNPQKFSIRVHRKLISDFLPPVPNPSVNYPALTKYCIQLTFMSTGGVAALTPEHTKVSPSATKYGSLIALQQRIDNVARFSLTTVYIGFWVRTSTSTSGYCRLTRQYNLTGTGTDSKRVNGCLDVVGIKTFTTSANTWTYVNLSFDCPILDATKTIVENDNGLVVQIGPYYYKFDGNTETLYGSYAGFTGTNIGLTWQLAEFQFRIDSPPTAATFTRGVFDREQSRRGITYCSIEDPSVLPTMPYSGSDSPRLAQGIGSYNPGYAGLGTNQFIYFFTIDFANELRRKADRMYWCTWDQVDPNYQSTVWNMFSENIALNTSDHTAMTYGATNLVSANLDQIDSVAVYTGASYVTTVGLSGSITLPITPMLIPIMRSTGAQLQFELDWNPNAGNSHTSQVVFLNVGSGSEHRLGYFVAQVDDFDSRFTGTNSTVHFDYCDVNYTTATSRPL